MSDIPFKDLLAKDGAVRAALKSTLQWGDWADVFCDALLDMTEATHLEDFTLTYGAQAANVTRTGDGRVQLNIAWKDRGSWSVYIADTYEEAVQQMWLQRAMIAQMTEERSNGQIPDPGHPGGAGALEILPWTG